MLPRRGKEDLMQDFAFNAVDDGTYCASSYHGDEAEVVIPETYNGAAVTMLYDGLFAGHKEITSVRIPETVTDLGEFIFDGCDSLKHIDLPKSLAVLWGYTFCRSSFEEIVLPDGVSSVPPFCFKDCKELRRIVFGKGMKEVHAWAFGGCINLEDIVNAHGVRISPEAFMNKELNT